MRELFTSLFGREPVPVIRQTEGQEDRKRVRSSDDYNWLIPPSTVVDPVAWDKYWQDQLSHGVGRFVHMFVNDGELVDAMRGNGLRTVLCVGSGISQEPRALAWAGFDVTALDISPLASKVAAEATPPEDLLANLAGKRLGGRDGRLEFVVGDLCDQTLCPGPYDVVIDRRTLQLWPDTDRPTAIEAVANRLAARGIFFSQAHDGRWKPPAPPQHAVKPWFVTQGWELWRRGVPITGRVAWLFTTTG